jgi:hypothetical protein
MKWIKLVEASGSMEDVDMFDDLSAVVVVFAVGLHGCASARPKPSQPAREPPSVSTPASAPAASSTPTSSDPNVGAATSAAQAWLAFVDQENYADSWTHAAKLFQGAVSQEKWTSAVTGVRGPLGKLVSRQLRSAVYKTSLPGAPDGKYVVVQFDAVFEKKAQAVETVTPMQEDDGVWRVSGYFIR